MALTKSEAVVILTRLGFRANTQARYTQAIKDFQRGFGFGAPLTIDGIKGPKTDNALYAAEQRRVRGLGTASAHFSFSEFVCKCGGRYSDCRRVWIARPLLGALEKSRTKVGRPIRIVSGCRCPRYNASIGGASASRHLSGDAVDWTGPDKDIVQGWNLWRGIGYGKVSDRALHTDLRPTSTTTEPTKWVYPGW